MWAGSTFPTLVSVEVAYPPVPVCDVLPLCTLHLAELKEDPEDSRDLV